MPKTYVQVIGAERTELRVKACVGGIAVEIGKFGDKLRVPMGVMHEGYDLGPADLEALAMLGQAAMARLEQLQKK